MQAKFANIEFHQRENKAEHLSKGNERRNFKGQSCDSLSELYLEISKLNYKSIENTKRGERVTNPRLGWPFKQT